MTILYPAPAAVKPARKARRFAAGLVASRPTYLVDHTADDEAWLVEDNARRAAEDRQIDRRYAESYATDCVSLGLIPSDAAEFIGATSIVGHMA